MRDNLGTSRRNFDIEDVNRRNKIAADALQVYYENVARHSEIPCYFCDGDDKVCESGKCPWFDVEEAGLWKLHSNEVLERAYSEADLPSHAANPFKYSPELGEFVAPGVYVPYVSSTSLADMLDEYERFASLFYAYGNAQSEDAHLHQHSFDGVVAAMMDDPENFYISLWAQDQYSEQEILLLEVVRERLCRDAGTAPKLPIVYDDGKFENASSAIEWKEKVEQRLNDLRNR